MRRVAGIGLWLLPAALLLTGCAAGEKHKTAREEGEQRWREVRARIKLQLAQRSFEARQLQAASEQCAEALALDAACLDAHLLMARIQLEEGELSRAQASVEAAAALAPEAAAVHHLRGLLAERRGDLASAADWQARASSADPDNLDYLLVYAQVLMRQGLFEQAAQALTPRLADFDQDPAIHVLMGQTAAMLGRRDEAARRYAAALRLQPENRLLREEAVEALLADGRCEEAVRAAEPLIGRNVEPFPTAVVARLVAGLLERDRADEAVRLLRRATGVRLSDPLLWRLLAQACLAAGDIDGAADPIARAMALDGGSPDTRLLLAYRLLLAGRARDAAREALALTATPTAAPAARAILEAAAAANSASSVRADRAGHPGECRPLVQGPQP